MNSNLIYPSLDHLNELLDGKTVAFFLARVLFHRFHESPRYLVHSGRKEEAAIALTKIAKFNGEEFRITIADVNDDEEQSEGTNIHFTSRLRHSLERSRVDEEGESLLPSGSPVSVRSTRPLISRSVSTHSRMSSTAGKIKSSGPVTLLRRWFGKPLQAWWSRIVGLLSGEWRQRTLLIWGVWMTMALAYTMFNVFLPTLLEYRSQTSGQTEEPETANDLSGALWEVMVFTLGGCPGALVGAYLVDQAPRRNVSKSLVLATVTFITGLACIAFVMLDGYIAIMLSTIAMSLTSTAMWSILYGMTPELFITEVRGTACGTASALSRVGGIAAPLIGGILVSINPTLVILTSVGVFMISCILLVLLDRNLKGWAVPTTPPEDSS